MSSPYSNTYLTLSCCIVQDGEPFALHISIDSDDEGDSDDESEVEAEAEHVKAKKSLSMPAKREGADTSSIELQDLSLLDPEQGGMGEATGSTDNSAD